MIAETIEKQLFFFVRQLAFGPATTLQQAQTLALERSAVEQRKKLTLLRFSFVLSGIDRALPWCGCFRKAFVPSQIVRALLCCLSS